MICICNHSPLLKHVEAFKTAGSVSCGSEGTISAFADSVYQRNE